jgi:hypothetical protein
VARSIGRGGVGVRRGDAEFDFVAPPKVPAGPPRSAAEMQAAKAYLADFGASLDAPRVTFDVLMAAAVDNDNQTADAMRTRLIFEHFESIQYRYLLTTLDAKTFRELLVKAGKERGFTADFSVRYCLAVEAGNAKWGGQFLTEDPFLFQCSLAARIAGRKPLLDYCRNVLTQKREPEDEARSKTRRAAEILFDNALSLDAKCLTLHRIEDHESARQLAEHFDERLPEDLRDRADLVEARIERMLERDKFAEALPVIESLLTKDGETPKRLFWRAWCEAATESASAAAHFQDLADRFPNDAWALPAREAAQAAAQLQVNLDAQSEAAAAVIRHAFTEEIKLIEGEGVWKRRSGDVRAYARFDLSSESGEAVIRKGEGWLAALRLEKDSTRLLLDGESSINVFHDKLPLNIPRPKLMFDPVSKKLDFSASFSSGTPSASAAGSSGEAPFDVLQNMTPEMIRPMLKGYVNKGWLPIAAASDATGTTYGWIEFAARKPDIERWKIRVSKEHHLETIDGPAFALQRLKYGPLDAFEPSPPKWPNLPVVEHAKFDPAVMFRAMAAITRLWNDEASPAAATAAANASEKR